MKQKIYYSLYDAECAAMNFEQKHPGSSIQRSSLGSYEYGIIDESSNAEQDERFTRNVDTWSGEIPAIVVNDANGNAIGKFGWWDDESD